MINSDLNAYLPVLVMALFGCFVLYVIIAVVSKIIKAILKTAIVLLIILFILVYGMHLFTEGKNKQAQAKIEGKSVTVEVQGK